MNLSSLLAKGRRIGEPLWQQELSAAWGTLAEKHEMFPTLLKDLAVSMAVPQGAAEMPHCMSRIGQGKASIAGELSLL